MPDFEQKQQNNFSQTAIQINPGLIKTMKKDLAAKSQIPNGAPNNFSLPKQAAGASFPQKSNVPKTPSGQSDTVMLESWEVKSENNFGIARKSAISPEVPPPVSATPPRIKITPESPPKPQWASPRPAPIKAVPPAAAVETQPDPGRKNLSGAAEKFKSLERDLPSPIKKVSATASTIKEDFEDPQIAANKEKSRRMDASSATVEKSETPKLQNKPAPREEPLKKIETPKKELTPEEKIAEISKKRQEFAVRYQSFSETFEKKIADLQKAKDSIKAEKSQAAEEKKDIETSQLKPILAKEAEIENDLKIIVTAIKALGDSLDDGLEAKRNNKEDERKNIEKTRWEIEDKVYKIDKKIQEIEKRISLLTQDEDSLFKEKEKLNKEKDIFSLEENLIRAHADLASLKKEKEKISQEYAQYLPKKNAIGKLLQEMIIDKSKNEEAISAIEEKERLAQGPERRHYEEQRQVLEEKRKILFSQMTQKRKEKEEIEINSKEISDKMQKLNDQESSLLKKIEEINKKIIGLK